ncbi:acid phosphatase PHO12 precursor [Bimuria novae-zelandiae CBS 107.79]|uniref:Acid phosphatase PHO12 n=1 Tax=Bimuria novae-zelandiae CBS 107.79 TaxID=1447943 RepID=A0A6A5VPJ8_9PLEO|nr:acid phosphatase PHO12 precursor [Bimuria novae-zelandiae CBS 107.79]
MERMLRLLLATATVAHVAAEDFNVLQHLGGNGPLLPGPEVTGISSDVPEGCKVDLAAFFSRHGSRYPDTGAYNEWTAFYNHIQQSPFTVSDPKLEFLRTWKPVLSDPSAQIAQISPTGYKELTEMGATWRLRYSDLYEYNTPFTLWANWYKSSPRVRDSARMFAHGFLGPNATELGTIYALNSSDPASWMNSLATSDLCPAYEDEEGGAHIDHWQSIYLPPIVSRLNARINGDFNFTQQEVKIIPYLCGFETQITGKRSPFCDIFTDEEILQYEYAQDLRYWYGVGLGTDIEKLQMLPTVDMLVRRFMDGPNATYDLGNSTFQAPNIMASFTNDGQINQLIAATGVFDNEPELPGNSTLPNRKFRVSRFTPMRGTVAFERLFCSPSNATGQKNSSASQKRPDTSTTALSSAYIRILLNDVVYPVANCDSGPGASCPLSQYQEIVKSKLDKTSSFTSLCNTTNADYSSKPQSTFFMDNTLSFANTIKP